MNKGQLTITRALLPLLLISSRMALAERIDSSVGFLRLGMGSPHEQIFLADRKLAEIGCLFATTSEIRKLRDLAGA